jgi:hypothetical protein
VERDTRTHGVLVALTEQIWLQARSGHRCYGQALRSLQGLAPRTLNAVLGETLIALAKRAPL